MGGLDKAAALDASATVRATGRGSSLRLLSLLSVLSVFTLWFFATADGLGLVSETLFPSPKSVFEALQFTAPLILPDIAATSGRVLVGLGIGVTLGVAAGLAMSYSQKVEYLLNPIVESMRPVPAIAMIPFFLLWFGIEETGRIILVTGGVFAVLVVSTFEAVRNVPKIYRQASAMLGATRPQTFRRVILPAITPELIGPIRVAAALSFTLVVAAEFAGAQDGLGYRIMVARRLFNPDVILLGVTIFGLLSAVLDYVVRRAGAHLTRWSDR